MKLALLTDSQHPHLTPDDLSLPGALARQGLEGCPVVWTAETDWRKYDAVLVRTPWDYTQRFPEFRQTLSEIQTCGIPLLPHRDLLDWNMDKRYLLDLEQRGIAVTPTRVDEQYSPAGLPEFFRELNSPELVVKPVVGAAGRDTFRVQPGQEGITAPLAGRPVLIQPFLADVIAAGERSLIFIDGRYSHAVDKIARSGEFRVQDDHGGSVRPARPDLEEIRQAETWLDRLEWPTLYARVDTVRNDRGRPVIMELELVEPELFFRFSPDSADRFAAAVRRGLNPS